MSLCKVRLNQQLAVYVTALFAMLQLLHLADTAVSKEEHCMMHRATRSENMLKYWAKSKFLLLHVSAQQKIVAPTRVLPAFIQKPYQNKHICCL